MLPEEVIIYRSPPKKNAFGTKELYQPGEVCTGEFESLSECLPQVASFKMESLNPKGAESDIFIQEETMTISPLPPKPIPGPFAVGSISFMRDLEPKAKKQDHSRISKPLLDLEEPQIHCVDLFYDVGTHVVNAYKKATGEKESLTDSASTITNHTSKLSLESIKNSLLMNVDFDREERRQIIVERERLQHMKKSTTTSTKKEKKNSKTDVSLGAGFGLSVNVLLKTKKFASNLLAKKTTSKSGKHLHSNNQ